MSLKHINAGFFITVVLFSVVNNLKHGRQQLVEEPIFSDIKRNITLVNHLLQDLLQKYAQLKQLARGKNVHEFFRGDSKIRLKAKVRLAEPRKPLEPQWLQTNNNFVEKSKFGISRIKKPRAEDTFDADNSPSPETRTILPITKRAKDLVTQIKESLERNLKSKESVKNYFSSENKKDIQQEVTEPHDVEKLLVIHLGDPTEANVKKKSASTSTQELILKTNQKLEPVTKSIVSESENTGSRDSDIQEEKEMQTEMLKVKQLRAAVGSACSQVVVRKCQKAIKSVLRDVCKSDRKCSKDFNNDFTSNGMAACNKVYNVYNQTIKNRGRYVDLEPNAGELKPGANQQQSVELTGAQFIDYTREGDLLLDMTCMQTLSKIKEPKVDGTSVKNTKTQDMNILRDKYEKACRKASFEKCRSACNSAADQTCNKYDCINEKMKALKFSCKRWCKANILYYGGNSSSGNSSSQSNSQSSSQSQSQSKSQSQSGSTESI